MKLDYFVMAVFLILICIITGHVIKEVSNTRYLVERAMTYRK